MNTLVNYLATNFIIYIAGFFVGGFAKIDVVFGVTVSRHLDDNGAIKEFKKDYRRIYGISAGFLLIAIIIANLYVEDLRWLFDLYVFIWFVLTIYLYIIFHKKVKNFLVELKKAKTSNSEKAKKRVVSASLANRSNEVKNIYLYFLPSIILLVITFIGTVLYYDKIPLEIPIHYNALGQVDQYADKSVLSVFGILIIEFLILVILYITCVGSIKYSKRRIDPRRPETSSMQITIANKRLALYISIMSFLLSSTFGIIHLGIFEALDLNSNILRIVTFAPTIIIMAGMVYYFATTGIYGDRVKLNLEEEEKDVEAGLDEDEGWFYGMIYYNKKDPSVFVPRRFGGGFTVNFASLAGKLFMLLILGIILFSLYLTLAK